jgi:hypothetical protein
MVRAPSGPTPRGTAVITRNSTKRNYRPAVEGLELKQLLSAGFATAGVQSAPPAVAVVTHDAPHFVVSPDGTGKGIVIITS